MARWKVKLELERAQDYDRAAELLAAHACGTWRLTDHVLDTVEGTTAAAGWCVRMRRTEARGAVGAESYTIGVRPHDQANQDAVAQVRGRVAYAQPAPASHDAQRLCRASGAPGWAPPAVRSN